MSGIVGSRFNIRGSGLIGSLGTDGQVFTSSGAGAGAIFEAAAAGGKIGQVVFDDSNTLLETTSTTIQDVTNWSVAITPAATTSYLLCFATFNCQLYGNDSSSTPGGEVYITDGSDTVLANTEMRIYHSADNLDSSFAGALNAFYTPDTTSEVIIKIRSHADAGRWAIYATSGKKNSSTLTVMEVLA